MMRKINILMYLIYINVSFSFNNIISVRQQHRNSNHIERKSSKSGKKTLSPFDEKISILKANVERNSDNKEDDNVEILKIKNINSAYVTLFVLLFTFASNQW